MPAHDDILPPFPLAPDRWSAMVDRLELSGQQARVAEMVMRGLGDKEIAAELGIGKGTVRTYIARLFVKMNVQDRIGLVVRLFVLAMSMEDRGSCPPSR